MRARLRALPLSLALLLAVAAIEALTWSLVIPALQGPDEARHFGYVQRMVERTEVPWQPGGVAGQDRFSTEVRTALLDAGLGPLAGNLGSRPLWTEADVRYWSARDAALTRADRRDGGTSSALENPPVYYAYEAIPYVLARGGSFFDRQIAMRLANVPLLLIALVFVWLVAGELLGRRSDQVLATGAAALIPQLINVTATVNPDVMLVAEWSAAIYLMILILRRGPQPRLLALLALLVVLAGFTHARSLPLLLPALMTVTIAFRLARPARTAAALGGVYLGVVLVASAWGTGSLREFGSYLWQFYLPKLGFMSEAIGPHDYGFRAAFTERLYGTLAQLEVVLPHALGTWLLWLTVLGLIALVVSVVVQRDALRRDGAIAAVLAATVLALLLGLHLAAYRSMLSFPDDPIITARYLLPLLPLFGVAIAIVARALPRMPGALFAGLVLAGGVALQFVSLGLLWERFYA